MKGRVITPKATIDYQNKVAAMVFFEIERNQKPLNEPCVLFMHFFKQDRRHKDGTNLAKAIEDALNKVLYTDDYLVVQEMWGMEYNKDNPRVIVGFMPYKDYVQSPAKYLQEWMDILNVDRAKY